MTSCNQTALEFSWSHRRWLNKFLLHSQIILMGKWRERTWWKWSQMENSVLNWAWRGMQICPLPNASIPLLYYINNHRGQESPVIVRHSYRHSYRQWQALGFSLTLTVVSCVVSLLVSSQSIKGTQKGIVCKSADLAKKFPRLFHVCQQICLV